MHFIDTFCFLHQEPPVAYLQPCAPIERISASAYCNNDTITLSTFQGLTGIRMNPLQAWMLVLGKSYAALSVNYCL